MGGRVHDVTLELSSARTAVVSPERSLKSDAPSETQRYPGEFKPLFAAVRARSSLSIALDLLSPWIITVLYSLARRARRCKEVLRVQNHGEQGRARLKQGKSS